MDNQNKNKTQSICRQPAFLAQRDTMLEREILNFRAQLRNSVRVCTELNLYHAAKWSAEALNGLETSSLKSNSFDAHNHFEPIFVLDNPQSEIDRILLAKTYFNVKEFARCAFILKDCQSNTAVFTRLYARFINGEKKFEEDSEGVLSSNDNQQTKNQTYLSTISKEMENLFNTADGRPYGEDPFLNYLYGMILLKQKLVPQAQEFFVKSIKLYPLNWSAWAELVSSIQTLDSALNIIDMLRIHFQQNPSGTIMLNFFQIVINQEFFQQNTELYDLINSLLKDFSKFSFLKSQKALISYHALEYQESEKMFDDILANDRYRIDDLDTYSNILYVMEKKSKLAHLAQLASSIDKFRPESCCIIANYYSLKFEHEKAIMYYRRALALNRNCLSAWTLMGHEFVELKNSHAAIESYRRAVDTNNKDFKAWYGLGQAYEVLDMHLYSLYYYQRASSLKPLDKRIWIALGNCYEKLNKVEDSIKSYQKAIELNTTDNSADDIQILYKIALLFEQINMISKVYEFMKSCYLLEINENMKNDETCKARIWLARKELSNGNYQLAYQYSSDLNYGSSQEIEEARNIAREARNRLNIK